MTVIGVILFLIGAAGIAVSLLVPAKITEILSFLSFGSLDPTKTVLIIGAIVAVLGIIFVIIGANKKK